MAFEVIGEILDIVREGEVPENPDFSDGYDREVHDAYLRELITDCDSMLLEVDEAVVSIDRLISTTNDSRELGLLEDAKSHLEREKRSLEKSIAFWGYPDSLAASHPLSFIGAPKTPGIIQERLAEYAQKLATKL